MLKLLSKSALARNTVWMSIGHGLRLAIQASYFALIVRCLGVNNYGAFVGVVALVGIAFPFGSLGSGNLLIKNVSRDRSNFAIYWGRALVVTVICGLALVVIVLAVSRFVLPPSIPQRLV